MGKTKVYVPIDVKAIASALHTDHDMVFGRLYYYLEQKDKFKTAEFATVHFFAFDEIPGERHCIQFSLMASVLATLIEEYERFLIPTWASRPIHNAAIFTAAAALGDDLESTVRRPGGAVRIACDRRVAPGMSIIKAPINSIKQAPAFEFPVCPGSIPREFPTVK
jgi:hypothetical protein